MPNATVRASAIALPDARAAIDPRAPDLQRDFIDDPSALPDRYAMRVVGHCLYPAIRDGDLLLFDKTADFGPGDLVMVYLRREAVKPGQFQAIVKRAVMVPPAFVTLPWRDHADSAFKPVVRLEMDNPQRRFPIRCADVLAIHKCLGPMPQGGETVRASLPAACRRSPELGAVAASHSQSKETTNA